MASEHSEEEIAKQIAEDELARKQEEFERLAKPPEATLKESRESGEYEPPLREDERRGKPGRFQFGAGDTKPTGQLLMAIGISVLLSFLIISQFMVSKGDFETNLNAMNATVSAAVNDMNQKVNAMSATVSGLSGTIANQVSTQVSTAVAQGTAGINNQLTTISGQITELTDKISSNESALVANQADLDTLLTQVATLEDKVAESTGDGTTTSYDGLQVEIGTSYFGPYLILEGLFTSKVSSTSTRVKLTNNTGYSIENIQLLAIVQATQTLPELDTNATDFASQKLTWQQYPSTAGNFLFVSATGWGPFGTTLTLDAGKSITLYPTFTLKASEEDSDVTYQFYIDVLCEGFDIAD